MNPDKYPVTRRFFELLDGPIRNNPLFRKVCELLANEHHKSEPDIEDVLSLLDSCQVDCSALMNTKSLLGWTMNGHMGNVAAIKGISDWNALRQSIQNYSSVIIELLNNEIKEKVHDTYTAEADSQELSVWIQFLDRLQQIDPCLEIFTTNYDNILEDSIRAAEIQVRPGRTFVGSRLKLDFSEWESLTTTPKEELQDRPYGLLTKLHGSVDWQWGKNETINISDTSLNDPKKHPVLYPGYKGVPEKKPFSIFHQHLRNSISGRYEPLTAAIFVGFAFRDEYINSILREIRPETPMYIINIGDELPPSVPPVGKPILISDGFTEKTAALCLRYIVVERTKQTDSSWRAFDRKNILQEKDKPAAYEFGDATKTVVYVGGSRSIRERLIQHLNAPRPCIGKHVEYYRLEYTPHYQERERELYEQHFKTHGHPPICNEVRPLEPE